MNDDRRFCRGENLPRQLPIVLHAYVVLAFKNYLLTGPRADRCRSLRKGLKRNEGKEGACTCSYEEVATGYVDFSHSVILWAHSECGYLEFTFESVNR